MSSFLSFKKKRIILKILSYISTASLLFTFVILPMQPVAHADIVAMKDMGAAGMITGYGAWNGTSLAFEIYQDLSNGVQYTGELIQGLWNQAYVELGTLPTYADVGEYYASGIISQYQVYGSPYSQIIITEEMASAFDSFWDWLLRREGLERDPETGLFEVPLDNSRNQIFEVRNVSIEGLQLYKLPFSYTSTQNGRNTNDWYITSLGSGSYVYGALRLINHNGSWLFVSDSPNSSVELRGYYDNNPTGVQTFSLDLINAEGLYYKIITTTVYTSSIPNQNIDFSQWVNTVPPEDIPETLPSVSLVLVENQPILIPDPASPDYEPQPVTIPTVIPYPPEYAPLPVPVPDPITGDFPEDAPDPEEVAEALAEPLAQGAIDGELVAENPELNPDPEPGPDPDAPVEVITPFLPVVFPSFNFSLSGIWHYVVEWVGTLGSWFSMVFTIWSHLPYAIVVPVYATAVVVIVLGVYKRFFM